MDATSFPPSLLSLHGLRQAQADLAQETWRQAHEALRKKDQEIAALQRQVASLEQDLRQRGQATLLEREFARLARVWKQDLRQKQRQAEQTRLALQADCERLRAHMQACRLAQHTLERYGRRLQDQARRRQACMLERESDDAWISRNHHEKAQPWM